MQRLKAASAIRLIQQRPPISNRSLFSLASLFRRSPKIGYLPFKALTSEDLKRIGVDWYQGFIPRILQRANAEKAPAQLKDLDYEKTTKLKAVRCYYLPYFQLDAKAAIGVKGTSGKSVMSVFLDSLPIPAHTHAELQLLQVKTPAAYFTKYESVVDVPRQLEKKILDQVPQVVPFEFTPAIVGDENESVKVDMGSIFAPIPNLQISSKATKAELEKVLQSTFRGQKQNESFTSLLHLDIGTFSLMFASMSPIYLPYYVAEYTTTSEHIKRENVRSVTIAYPGWVPYSNRQEIDAYTDYFKAAPSSSGLPRRQTWVGELQMGHLKVLFDSKVPTAVHNDEEQVLREVVELAHVESLLQQRVQYWIRQVLGTNLPKFQTKDYERNNPDANKSVWATTTEADLGPNINWNSQLILAPSGCDGKSHFRNARAYYEADLKVQESKSELHIWIKSAKCTDGGKAARQHIAKLERQRDSLAPSWLQNWQHSLGPELYKPITKIRQLMEQNEEAEGHKLQLDPDRIAKLSAEAEAARIARQHKEEEEKEQQAEAMRIMKEQRDKVEMETQILRMELKRKNDELKEEAARREALVEKRRFYEQMQERVKVDKPSEFTSTEVRSLLKDEMVTRLTQSAIIKAHKKQVEADMRKAAKALEDEKRAKETRANREKEETKKKQEISSRNWTERGIQNKSHDPKYIQARRR